ncbi:hypothetical protein EDB92DRAFT_1993605 [Lactarius akahatsu]|uniref:DUF6534 domain-containing protein n=1 Tax=Lactarius akahatsu TaxID=416441 RepID=A0AAD4Q816_9AGAM|nr:hypothetical protein EDB92DRAFT_1993605 [Lactarius akahatsu]
MSTDIRFGTWKTYEAVPVLPKIEVLGYDFLAPYSLCLFISALEMGVIVVCFARFMAHRAEAESSPIKLLVYYLTFVSLFQTGTTFAAWWEIFVVDFGNWGAAAVPAWPQKVHTSLTTLLAAPVQLFLTWRCWHLMKRKWFIALPLVLMVIGTIITTIYVIVILFRIKFASKDTLTVELHTFFTCYVVCLVFSAAIDISVTGILLVFLIRSRSKVYTKRFRKVLSQLICITWESAIPPCTCALAALIASMRGAPFVSYWAVLLQTILGKLYVISLFVTLEARAKLADVTNLTHFPTLTNTTRLDGRWSVARDDSDQTDPTQGSQLPVHLALVPCKIVTRDDTAVEASTPDYPLAV